MVCVVGVRFRNAGKVYYFDPEDMQLSEGDKVIVETVRGLECGDVVGEAKPVPEEEITQPLRKVVRKATPEDEAAVEANREKERRGFKIGLDKIAAHSLPMKLVDVEYTFDGSKIVFFFTADGRVDFRELVRDLASVFRTRIELRQIGVRDEAKMVGGLGPCGRPLCCTAFLKDFEPVSIRMAKDQNLSLNPTKISGICGRLMCCLKYEHNVYKDLRQDLPSIGSEIETGAGIGKVSELDVLNGVATVKLQDGKTVRVDVRRLEVGCGAQRGNYNGGPREVALPGEAADGHLPEAPAAGGAAAGCVREEGDGVTEAPADAADDATSGQTAGAVKAQQDRPRRARRRRRRQHVRELGGQAGTGQLAPAGKPGSRAPGNETGRRTGTGGANT